ncbi:hypothetical protein BSKO_02267 [Bryopsis sp. KO-2023]|nr:hypothetical protein BSKO_02267 [Bryopsis sp. KO-2023]
MGELNHKETVYYDAQNFKDDSALALEAEITNLQNKRETVYHDAQVLQFGEPSPRTAPRKKSKKTGCSFLCCFRARADDDHGSSVELGKVTGRLSSIQEASLTREQMLAQECSKSKEVNRTPTQFYSLGNSASVPSLDEPSDNDEASITSSVVRKLSNLISSRQLAPSNEKGTEKGSEANISVRRKLSNILTKAISRKATVRAVLNDEEFEFFSRYHGWWTADNERSDPKDDLARTMELGWALRKAMDNMQDAFYGVQRDRIRNSARVFGLVDIKENRPWSGEKVKLRRKDMRGGMTTWVEKKPNSFVYHSEWPDPYAAYASEEHTLLDGGETMLLHAYVKRESGPSCTFNLYFKKKH